MRRMHVRPIRHAFPLRLGTMTPVFVLGSVALWTGQMYLLALTFAWLRRKDMPRPPAK